MKTVLDACCGGKMFWFQKDHPSVLYVDKRICHAGHNKYRKNHMVEPDVQMDFRSLAFAAETFRLVVFDPPHLKLRSDEINSAKLYGRLDPTTWRDDLSKVFSECWRVLESGGVLIFKWHESSVKISEVLKLFPETPLFGNRQGTKLNTHWMVFFKMKDIVKKGGGVD